MDNEILILNGNVVDGCGRFADELFLPPDLLKDDLGWIKTFVPGTLNIKLHDKSTSLFGKSKGLRSLDSNSEYPPHIYRDGQEIGNNTKGGVQLWRATLLNVRLGTSYNCYVIRRIGSDYQYVAEILGSIHFRDEDNFMTNDPVKLEVFFSNS